VKGWGQRVDSEMKLKFNFTLCVFLFQLTFLFAKVKHELRKKPTSLYVVDAVGRMAQRRKAVEISGL
jgi:hypothetical protein